MPPVWRTFKNRGWKDQIERDAINKRNGQFSQKAIKCFLIWKDTHFHLQ